jgi:hypothetical protein
MEPQPPTDANQAVTIGADTAYAFCSFVDGATTWLPASFPTFWQQAWVPDGDVNGHTATVFQMFLWILLGPFTRAAIPLPVWALAIQGTKTGWDVLNDFQVDSVVEFPPISGALIAIGSQEGLNDILALERTSKGSTESLQDFLMNFAAGSKLLVTGHSLGGNVASVLAPWIAANVPAFGGNGGGEITALPPDLSAITFAAPTAGNEPFASFLNGQPSYQANFNTNDVVPHVWAASGPWSAYDIDNLYSPPGPPAPGSIKIYIAGQMQTLTNRGISYTQTNGNAFTCPVVAAPGSGETAWKWELEYQHNYGYCVQFLGPKGNCQPPAS